MVFTITTYYKPVRRHLYGVYHHNLLEGTSMVTIRHLDGVYHHNLLQGRHLYGVYHHNLLQSC